jgi:hypothetical protein
MLIDPADLPAGVDIGTPGRLEYAMVWPFTPEGQRNLRSLIVAFQDPENYGKLVSLRIPQGEFVPGPEQIESYIDNESAGAPAGHDVDSSRFGSRCAGISSCCPSRAICFTSSQSG